MKKLFAATAIILILSCNKQEVMNYSGQDGIAFYIGQYEVDSLSFSFAFSVEIKSRDTVFLPMRLVGPASDFNRVIKVVAGEGTTARPGIDFELPDIILPAGEITVDYPVVLINSPELEFQTVRLIPEVGISKDLVPGATGREIGNSINLNRFKIDFSNQLVRPSYWSNSVFGVFSVVKFRFMMEITGLTDFSTDTIGVSGTYSMPVMLRNALADYEAINGPLMDETGNQVSF